MNKRLFRGVAVFCFLLFFIPEAEAQRRKAYGSSGASPSYSSYNSKSGANGILLSRIYFSSFQPLDKGEPGISGVGGEFRYRKFGGHSSFRLGGTHIISSGGEEYNHFYLAYDYCFLRKSYRSGLFLSGGLNSQNFSLVQGVDDQDSYFEKSGYQLNYQAGIGAQLKLLSRLHIFSIFNYSTAMGGSFFNQFGVGFFL